MIERLRPMRSRPRRSQPIDFPAVIERAYADGVGVFLEVGPGSSCTRLIGQILGGRPHRAFSACRPDREPAVALLDVLGELISHRAAVDLARLYGNPTEDDTGPTATAHPRTTASGARCEWTCARGHFKSPHHQCDNPRHKHRLPL